MKKYGIIICSFLIFIAGCSSHKAPSTEELKLKYGDFNGKTIKWLPVDYSKGPIKNKLLHHPEDYKYLDKVDIYHIAHISDGLFLTGFMIAPKASGKYPCVVYNRGGNQNLGQLLLGRVVEMLAPFAAEGYVVIATNYRGNSGGEGKEQFGGEDVNDVINLIKSLDEFEKADTDKVGLVGMSRGGMMNFLTLKRKSNLNIKTIINICGITDLEKTIKFHPQIEDVGKELIPEFKANRSKELIKRSAVHWATELSKEVPILILHSMDDAHVDYSQIPVFADSLDKHELNYQLISFKNDIHGLLHHKNEVKEIILDWINKYVKDELPFKVTEKRIIIE